MSRLIDADEVLKSCVDEKGNYLGHDAAVVGEAVSAAPTVDAVPVVRCRECRNWANEWWCRKYPNFRVISPDWYCASGERKGGDE